MFKDELRILHHQTLSNIYLMVRFQNMKSPGLKSFCRVQIEKKKDIH